MITVHPDQNDPKYKHNHMTYRARVKTPLYVNGVYDRIETHMLKHPHNMLVHLAALYYGINKDIVTLNKERRGAYFQSVSHGASRKHSYYISIKYYLKWLKQP